MKYVGNGRCFDTGKVIIRTKHHAKVLRRTIRRGGDDQRGERAPIKVYRCTHCGYWHLGHRFIEKGAEQ